MRLLIIFLFAFYFTDIRGQGQLSSGDESDGVIAAPFQEDTWTFSANAEDQITISIAETSDPSGSFMPSIWLYAPDGSYLSSGSGHYVGSISRFEAPQSGTYTILAYDFRNPRVGGRIGDYKIRLYVTPGPYPDAEDGGTLINGTEKDGSISLGDIDAWTFSANSEDQLTISITETSDPSGSFMPSIWLYAPDGSYLSSGSGHSVGSISRFEAPQSGTYTILAYDFRNPRIGDRIGNYKIRLYTTPGPYLGAEDGGALINDTKTNGSISLGDIDAWTFSAYSEDRITISINETSDPSGSFMPSIWLYAPDGSYLAVGSGHSAGSISRLEAPQSGTYTVLAYDYKNPRIGDRTGDYEISLNILGRPLLFIPGIAGSRLIGGTHTGARGNFSYLWPTVRPDKIKDLNLASGAIDVEAVDVVRSFPLNEDVPIPGLDLPDKAFYGPFLDFMAANSWVEFNLAEDPSRMTGSYLQTQEWQTPPNLFVFPYDWRQDNASHMSQLRSYISNIRDFHEGRKVHIVAHSMGGLLAKRYLSNYGVNDVASVTTVGSPVWGAPQTVFRLLTGTFYGPNITSAIDWINEDSMRDALWSMPSVAQLLPTNNYILSQGGFILAEAGWDLDNDGDDSEFYDPLEYAAFLSNVAEQQGAHFDPIIVSQLFNTSIQTDWSDLPASLPTLIITGDSLAFGAFPSTPIGVIARSGPWYSSLNPGGVNANIFEYERFDPVYGRGDGTVPLLSSERLDTFLPPNRQELRISGGSEANHMGLLSENPEVWQAILNFLTHGSPQAILPKQSQLPSEFTSDADKAPPSDAAADNITSVLVKGSSYVSVVDGEGNANTRLSAGAALSIDEINIGYAKNSVLVEFALGRTVTLHGDESGNTEPLEIEVLEQELSGDNRNLTALRRFEIPDGSVLWKLSQDSTSQTTLLADLNGDGILDSSDEIVPLYDSSTEVLDGNAPTILMQLRYVDSDVMVTLGAIDDQTTTPKIIYSIDEDPLTEYSVPLRIPRFGVKRLRAFSEDTAGNKSGLVETVLNPSIEIDAQSVPPSIKLMYPISDGYQLEYSEGLSGDWAPFSGPVTRRGAKIEVILPLVDSLFFRLKGIDLEK